MSSLELLSPARTADIGIEAVRHGADAVYIGAERFGARQAAGNSVADIARLVEYAHVFGARVYVTLNTLLHDDELAEAERMVQELKGIDVDALIVQDVAVVGMAQRVGMPVHASTQMDNRTAEQVQRLTDAGIEQVVLARELSLDDIRQIHTACPQARLEAFVHGALCVSLSGRCYASEVLFGRSANRGACAQVCRMEFDLEDERGHKLLEKKHLLSLKDLCQLDRLEEMAEAGVTSFKIEGRLKDMAYVKNVTAAYSEALNTLCRKYPDRYRRSSRGEVDLKFRPDVRKSFNRGFTHYFLDGRNPDIFSFDTPKAVGVEIGKSRLAPSRPTPLSLPVREGSGYSFEVDFVSTSLPHREWQGGGSAPLHNGDGLCFFNRARKLVGFRVNRVEGNRVWPHPVPHDLLPGMTLYRNFDKAFNDVLAHESAERYLPVDVSIDYDGEAFLLTMTGADDEVTIRKEYQPELARTHQAENIERQFSRMGGTPYRLRSLHILYKKNYFIPSSVLAEWRRELTGSRPTPQQTHHLPLPVREGSSNKVHFEGVTTPHSTREGQVVGLLGGGSATEDLPLMTCRHCLRYAMGWCQRPGGTEGPRQLFLRLENGAQFRLHFDCQNCAMQLFLVEK
ncbi:MAG: U32 family peptidase [Bacteroidaceae bacterium]|nr:U32 family peptidase [Bacteroidaceae bacterium]